VIETNEQYITLKCLGLFEATIEIKKFDCLKLSKTTNNQTKAEETHINVISGNSNWRIRKGNVIKVVILVPKVKFDKTFTLDCGIDPHIFHILT
jgi:hypothetical protein